MADAISIVAWYTKCKGQRIHRVDVHMIIGGSSRKSAQLFIELREPNKAKDQQSPQHVVKVNSFAPLSVAQWEVYQVPRLPDFVCGRKLFGGVPRRGNFSGKAQTENTAAKVAFRNLCPTFSGIYVGIEEKSLITSY